MSTSNSAPNGSAEGPRIRPMTAEDLPEVHRLETSLFPIDAWPLQMFREELRYADTRAYYVAEDSAGRIIGYAGLMCVLPIADVQTIAVVPESEGAGVGSRLLTLLIEEAIRRGADDVLLEVRHDNPRAQRLYRWFGFRQIHVRPRYYRDGADALIMQLPLAEWQGPPVRDGAARPGEAATGSADDTTTTKDRP